MRTAICALLCALVLAVPALSQFDICGAGSVFFEIPASDFTKAPDLASTSTSTGSCNNYIACGPGAPEMCVGQEAGATHAMPDMPLSMSTTRSP